MNLDVIWPNEPISESGPHTAHALNTDRLSCSYSSPFISSFLGLVVSVEDIVIDLITVSSGERDNCLSAGQTCNRSWAVYSKSWFGTDCACIVHVECASLSVQVWVDGCGAFEAVWLEWSAVRVLDFVPGAHVTRSIEGKREWLDSVAFAIALFNGGKGEELWDS